MLDIPIKERLIIALDHQPKMGWKTFIREARSLGVCWFKLGYQQILPGWPTKYLSPKQTFIDLKVRDTKDTIEAWIKSCCDADIGMITVDSRVAEIAVRAKTNPNTKILYVDKLTDDKKKFSYPFSISTSINIGCDGIILKSDLAIKKLRDIASGETSQAIKKALQNGNFLVVSPGIRRSIELQSDYYRIIKHIDPVDNHVNSVTPLKALQNGTDYIVVGRPITLADDPLKVIQEIFVEMKQIS